MPDCLKDLTLPEQLMLSPIICKAYVVKLVSYGHPNASQRAIKGNSIAFMQDVHTVAKTLPDLESTAKYLKVCFVGDSTTPLPLQQMKKILRVRRQKVKDALEFLIKHHVGFQQAGITIDHIALACLPVDDIPQNILDNIDRSDNVDAALAESSSYIPQSIPNIVAAYNINCDTNVTAPDTATEIVDLSATDLSSQDLSGADLPTADLSPHDLSAHRLARSRPALN